jgi:ADP-dependent NAD(P)H-hydrate dehydratase / NAD(P)H-hydrate epimerase
MLLVSAEEMRELDRLTIEKYGTPGHVLMERAGKGATAFLLDSFPALRRKGARVVVCAGKGNNGGDGFVMARLLRQRGVATEVLLFGRAADVRGDAARNLGAYTRGRSSIGELTDSENLEALDAALVRADVVIDAIFGTGLGSPVRGLQAEAIERINRSGVPVFAVDIPSGLDSDTGLPLGACICAQATATFGFAKIGQVTFPGAGLVGKLRVVDIGIASEAVAERPPQTELLEPGKVGRLVPVRRADAHKGDCGHLLVIAGSFGKTGAAQLVSRAALRSGAGLVTLVGPAALYPIYASGVLEVMTEVLPDRDGRMLFEETALRRLLAGKSAVAIGPGIGTHDEASAIVRWLLTQEDLPLLLDADAITCLSSEVSLLERAAAQVVLTPHPGEMARLLGGTNRDVQAERVGTARRFAREHSCTLVLKGARTVIASQLDDSADAFTWINPTGNPGMASGGMGDVLSGIIGGLLAQRLAPPDAARLGVYVHGSVADAVAAQSGEVGLLASDIIQGLPAGLRALRDAGQAAVEKPTRAARHKRATVRKA